MAASYFCSSWSFFILYPFPFSVLKCGGLCNKSFYGEGPWTLHMDFNLQLKWSSPFLLKNFFSGRISQKAKREIYSLKVTKQSWTQGQHSQHGVLVVFGERNCPDPHHIVDEMVSHHLMQYLQKNCCLYLEHYWGGCFDCRR